MMEKFAEQLHLSGEFEKALKHYKQTLQKQETEPVTWQEALLHRTPDFAGALVEGIPFAGPILREATKATTAHLINEHHTTRLHKDAVQVENPLVELTKAFVTELNYLANTKITRSSRKARRLRVILFFDTFEQLAGEAVAYNNKSTQHPKKLHENPENLLAVASLERATRKIIPDARTVYPMQRL